MKKGESAKIALKFPVLNGVEYIDLMKSRNTVLSIDGKELENFSWRQLQTFAGERITPGQYNYVLKFKDRDEIYRGTLRAVSTNDKGINRMELKEIDTVKKSVDEITKRLNSLKSDTPGMDLIISLTKQSYETQITFLRDELTRKDRNIDKLERDIEKLNDDLDKADELIEDLKSKTGINQYLSIAKEFLVMKAGKMAPVSNLKDSDRSDIPDEILTVLGLVDYSKIDEKTMTEIIHFLKIFIQKLPLKGSDN